MLKKNTELVFSKSKLKKKTNYIKEKNCIVTFMY